MSQVPVELKYSESHEWIKDLGDNQVLVGISDHAQALLGELVYVELPEVEAELKSGDEVGVVESVKAASDVYTPVSGTITEVNEALEGEPDLVNKDPYNEGWLFKMKLNDQAELENMMSAERYQTCIESEEE